jgi:hypothetical protein
VAGARKNQVGTRRRAAASSENDQRGRRHHEPGLLGGFAHGGVRGCRQLVGVGDAIRIVDAASGEDPHAAEREARVLPQHERLEPVVAVAQEDDRGGIVGIGHGLSLSAIRRAHGNWGLRRPRRQTGRDAEHPALCFHPESGDLAERAHVGARRPIERLPRDARRDLEDRSHDVVRRVDDCDQEATARYEDTKEFGEGAMLVGEPMERLRETSTAASFATKALTLPVTLIPTTRRRTRTRTTTPTSQISHGSSAPLRLAEPPGSRRLLMRRGTCSIRTRMD